jgi:TonB family protein
VVLRLCLRNRLKTMSSTSFQSEEFPRSHERRRFPRVRLPSLAYVDVDADNGGILLNLSENGVALQAVSPFVDLTRVSLRIQPPKPRMRIDVSAEITWLSESKKEAGFQFFELSDDTRIEIANWISAEGGAREPRPNDDSSSPQIAQVSSTHYAEDTPPRRRKWTFLLENSPAEDAPANQKAPNDVLNPSMRRRNLEWRSHATLPDKSPCIPTFDPDPDNEKIHARTSGPDDQPNSPTILSEHIPRPTQFPSLEVPPPPAAGSTVQPPSAPAAELIAKHYEISHAHIPTSSKESPHSGERRRFTRQRLCSLAYLDIGPDNGGMVLNLSETGLALQAFNPLIGQTRVGLRIQPPKSRKRIQATAEITWLSESKREAGLKFIDLAEDARVEIAEWVSAEAGPATRRPLEESTAAQTRHVPSSPPITKEPSRLQGKWTLLTGDSTPQVTLANQKSSNYLANSSVGRTNLESPPDVIVWEKVLDDPTNNPDSNVGASRPRTSNGNELAVNPSIISEHIPGVVGHSAPELPLPLAAASSHQLQSSTAVDPIAKRDETPNASIPEMSSASRQSLPERFQKWWTIAALCTCTALLFLFLGMAITRGLRNGRLGKMSVDERFRDASAAPSSRTASGAPHQDSAFPSEVSGSKTRHKGVEAVARASRTESPRKDNSENPQPGPPGDGTDSPVAKISSPIEPPQQTANSDSQNASVPSSLVLPVDSSGAHNLAVAQPEMNPSPPASAERRTDCYLLYRVEPLYPREAKEKHIEGTVALHLLIGSDGRVRSVRELSGPGPLVLAALSAAREWRFIPALRNGQPIEAEKDVSIEFHLPN